MDQSLSLSRRSCVPSIIKYEEWYFCLYSTVLQTCCNDYKMEVDLSWNLETGGYAVSECDYYNLLFAIYTAKLSQSTNDFLRLSFLPLLFQKSLFSSMRLSFTNVGY